jgi:alpha-L-rhamnosidase
VLPRYWIGDWGSIVEGWKEGDPPCVTTAFYYLDAVIVSKAARALGRPSEAARYAALAGEIRNAFRRTYYHPQNHQFDQGTQFSNALPLCLSLTEAEERGGVLDHILSDLERRGGHFDVGVLGAKYLMDALTQNAHADVAFRLAIRTGYPSWAHLLEGGRTTLSEFWDRHGSHNHVMMGSVDAWFYRTLAGIDVDETRPGFAEIRIQPFIPESLKEVRASVETVRGPVSVAWRKSRNSLRIRVGIPANSTATIRVPTAPFPKVRCIPERSFIAREDGAVRYELGSGNYEFRGVLK